MYVFVHNNDVYCCLIMSSQNEREIPRDFTKCNYDNEVYNTTRTISSFLMKNISVGVVFDYADTLSALLLIYTGSETVVDNVETCPHSQQRSLTRTVFIILKDRKILKETKQ